MAEVTGRSRRIVAKVDGAGDRRLAVESRAGSANLAETQAFQDDEKRILVFSDAGGTGRSYHADLGARNRRLRVHYLLEAGWKADTAIQGLGRTNRTNQAQPPLFRPIATDVKAEKRFLSTIARRLDTLGAITKGQRQTGGQGLFRPEDNLESVYARAALRQLYALLYAGKVEGCSLKRFEDATGLTLTDRDGSLKEELPPISQFLNRLLALTIDMQNTLFAAFEALLEAKIEGAIASGTYDVGVETIAAASLRIVERRTIYTHPGTGAATQVFTIARRDRNEPLPLADALEQGAKRGCRLLLNGKSHRAAVQVPAPSVMLDDGSVERRVRLVRPLERPSIAVDALAATAWRPTEPEAFTLAWEAELAQLPEFRESTLHVVTGLLLPIWRQLPNDGGRVYRLQSDEGERVIGRQVSPAWVAAACATVPEITPEDAFAGLHGRAHGPASRRRSPAAPRARDACPPHRAHRLHRRHARAADGLWPVPRDHRLEAQNVRAHRRARHRGAGQGPGALPAAADRRAGGRVTWDPLPISHAASRRMPKRCAASTSRMAAAKETHGASATSTIRRAAASWCA